MPIHVCFTILLFVLLMPPVAGAAGQAELVVVKPWEASCKLDQQGERVCTVEMFGAQSSSPMTGVAVIVDFKPEPYLTVLVVRGGLFWQVEARVDNSKAEKPWFCISTYCRLQTLISSVFVVEMMTGENMWIRAYNEDASVALEMPVSLMGFAEAVENMKSLPAK